MDGTARAQEATGSSARARPSAQQLFAAVVDLVSSGQSAAAFKRTARRYSLCPEDAEDAYQRALEILITKAPTDDPEQLRPWLQTVIKHEALAVRRQRERLLPAGEDPMPELAETSRGPDEEASERERAIRTAQALGGLKQSEVQCMLLKALGYSYDEIAERTGFSWTKVNRSLTEGRRSFLDRFQQIETGRHCRRFEPAAVGRIRRRGDQRADAPARATPSCLPVLPRPAARLPRRAGACGGADSAGTCPPRASQGRLVVARPRRGRPRGRRAGGSARLQGPAGGRDGERAEGGGRGRVDGGDRGWRCGYRAARRRAATPAGERRDGRGPVSDHDSPATGAVRAARRWLRPCRQRSRSRSLPNRPPGASSAPRRPRRTSPAPRLQPPADTAAARDGGRSSRGYRGWRLRDRGDQDRQRPEAGSSGLEGVRAGRHGRRRAGVALSRRPSRQLRRDRLRNDEWWRAERLHSRGLPGHVRVPLLPQHPEQPRQRDGHSRKRHCRPGHGADARRRVPGVRGAAGRIARERQLRRRHDQACQLLDDRASSHSTTTSTRACCHTVAMPAAPDARSAPSPSSAP